MVWWTQDGGVVSLDERVLDTLIIGGGPAGLTAALYAGRAGLRAVLVEKAVPGGQIATTDLVDNYPGFPDGILGPELSERMEKQARRFGTEIVFDEVVTMSRENGLWTVRANAGEWRTRTVILATGAHERKLGVPGEDEFRGRGVSYCAICDGAFFKGRHVAVVGGGDSALTEGMFLARICESVTIIHRRDELRAAKDIQERAFANPRIKWLWSTQVTAIEGDQGVRRLRLRSTKDGTESSLDVDGVFIYVGMVPQTEFVKGVVALNEAGYVLTDADLRTSAEAVWAAGDVRAGSLAQVATAVGEGTIAALEVESYLAKLDAGQKPAWDVDIPGPAAGAVAAAGAGRVASPAGSTEARS
ncbi:MAG: thioredoxin-disulfide reductase [Clostridia bacterium]|nr:thioredoxin-disulfide reductase [Clostridia bacterium]